MMADVAGNIRYVRTGRVPIRPAGYDFGRPVPGDRRATEWLGLHPMGDLVQLLNPATGYLQNCNIGPDTMARNLGLDPVKYPPYVYHSAPGATNSRGRRAVELLEANAHLTVAEAQAIALDIHADRCELWLAALRQAAQAGAVNQPRRGVDPATAQQAVARLLAWDGQMDQGSTAATLYRGWREFCARRKIDRPEPPDAKLAAALLDCLAEALAWLQANYGGAEVPYGQIHRVVRGSRSWPISGGESGTGMALRAVGARLVGKAFVGDSGQNWLQLVQLRRGAVRSWSLTPYGNSDNPASPHYADQAEQLFSPGKLKPTWFDPAELEGHVEATLTLRR